MSADEMFQELGYYKKVIPKEYSDIDHEEIRYGRYIDKKLIKFNLDCKQVLCEYLGGLSASITMQELQAINKKCKEIGWIE